ncbi:MAG TPA: biotin-dependent carboxyltransferase family protein [Syntrophales bacterium]|nr:biotin-dependent carboxyltransferase family protein [Syntrophales bacterium]
MLEILKPGMLTTVQDLGRPGYLSMGVPVSGASDPFSLKMGNRLVGNQDGEAGIEILLYGLQLRALAKMIVAVTGADLGAKLNQAPIPLWRTVELEKGDVISFPSFVLPSKKGCRAYLAVAGGIDVPVVLGSKSTCLPANFGGFEGRALKKGDVLRIGSSALPLRQLTGRRLKEALIPDFTDHWEVRTVLGPQDHLFTEESIGRFYSHKWRVSHKVSRFGVRYIGPKFEFKPRPPHQVQRDPKGDPSNIVTQGVPLGAIEVAGGVEPIAISVDGPSTTGFVILANTISADLWKIGQTKPDDFTTFRKVDVDEAYRILADAEKTFRDDPILTD